MPHSQHATFTRCHLQNMPHSQHATFTTCHILNMPHSQHAKFTTCQIHNMLHSQNAPFTTCHIHNMPHSQHAPLTTCPIHNMTQSQHATFTTCRHLHNVPGWTGRYIQLLSLKSLDSFKCGVGGGWRVPYDRYFSPAKCLSGQNFAKSSQHGRLI